MKNSLINREKECVRITSELLYSHQMDSIEPLLRRIVCYYSNSFSDGEDSLVCLGVYCFVQLPFAVLFTPIAVPLFIYMYVSEYWKARQLRRRHINYIEPEPKHIQVLWNEYGLTSVVEDSVLAETVSNWLCLLYPKKFHTSPQEIEKQLFEGRVQRTRTILRLLDIGARVQMEKLENVILKSIFDELPNYDGVN